MGITKYICNSVISYKNNKIKISIDIDSEINDKI